MSFLKKNINGKSFDLLIDSAMFPKDIVFKAAYNYLDRGYFFFRYDDKGNIILQFTPKPETHNNPEDIIGLYADELLDVYLRDKLEKDNKIIREAIVTKALSEPLDMSNFVTYDSDNRNVSNIAQNQIDFDRDIDDILQEIEDDPDLKINDAEISKVLEEIESNKASKIKKPSISINPEGIGDIKNMFKK